MKTSRTLSKEFQSNPSTLKSKINDIESVEGMNKHIKQKIKQIEQNTAATKLQNAIRNKKARGIANQKMAEKQANDLTSQIIDNSLNDFEDIFKKDAAVIKIQSAIRSKKARNELINTGVRQKLKNDVKPIINDMIDNAVRQSEISNRNPISISSKPTNTKSLLEQELTASRERAHKLYEAAIAKHPKKILYDSMVKSGDIQNAAAARTRRINEKTMKARQLIDDVKVKQLQAVKNDAIKKDATEKIQKAIRRKNAQNDITKIKQAKEKIQGNVKALLTEKAKIMHLPKYDKTIILNKKTVGLPLAVSKKLELISKKKHVAAKAGYENRQAFLEMAKQYKDVMKKGKK